MFEMTIEAIKAMTVELRQQLLNILLRDPELTTRERLPDLRPGINHHFTIIHKAGDGVEELDGYLRTGCYEDGRLGEIFLTIDKPGTAYAVYDVIATLVSFCLQHGISVDEICRKLVGQRYEPYGAAKHPQIPRCTSVVDYVAKYLLLRYGKTETTLVEGGSIEGGAL